jgi:prepilin-type N-terminal cleavage/methylation domain-containing protein
MLFMRRTRGFTLIELLIVVAIIAILAALAVPNFLEAQTRAKVSRAKSDLHALKVALEVYYVDRNAFPQSEINGTLRYIDQLSTPVSYIGSAKILDPFTGKPGDSIAQIATYRYYGFNGLGVLNADSDSGKIISPRADTEEMRVRWYALMCHGPDRVRNSYKTGPVTGTFVKQDNIGTLGNFVHFVYDPSNGTVSPGEIFLAGGNPTGTGEAAGRFMTDGH